MHSAIAAFGITALLGLSSAAPTAHGAPSYGGGQKPFKFPLSNGFPNIKVPSKELSTIEQNAHGTLPNGALPKSIGDTTATDFQLIAFNEIFEVAFFSSLLSNITSGAYDKEIGSAAARKIVHDALFAVRAQEELHSLGANAILSSAGREPIKPCEYVFPTSNFEGAIALAATFTDVVLGTLAGAQADFAADGSAALIPLIGSVIGQEGEQDGYYRSLGKKIPSALPFLTASAGPFAYSALNQLFIVPGSCPNADMINIPIFPALSVLTPPKKLMDQTVKYSFTSKTGKPSASGLSLVYINQQNVPVVEKLMNVQVKGNTLTFEAAFPAKTGLMNGLTIAAVTQGAGPFASPAEVAKATKYGPGLIELN